jgi:hypothetical protein
LTERSRERDAERAERLANGLKIKQEKEQQRKAKEAARSRRRYAADPEKFRAYDRARYLARRAAEKVLAKTTTGPNGTTNKTTESCALNTAPGNTIEH